MVPVSIMSVWFWSWQPGLLKSDMQYILLVVFLLHKDNISLHKYANMQICKYASIGAQEAFALDINGM